MHQPVEGGRASAWPWLWPQRFRRQVLYDYNRTAATYWALSWLLGMACLVAAAHGWWHGPVGPASPWQVWALVGLAGLAGRLSVPIAGTPRISNAAELPVLLTLMLAGAPAATWASAVEAAVLSGSYCRRWSMRLVNPAFAAICMFTLGSGHDAAVHALQQHGQDGLLPRLAIAVVFAAVYFAAHVWMVGAIPPLKQRQPWQPWGMLRSCGWISWAYLIAAVLATLLAMCQRQYGLDAVLAAFPITLLVALALRHRAQLAAMLEQLRAGAGAQAADAAPDPRQGDWRHQALHDGLTGLPNRRQFDEQLAKSLAEPGAALGLLFIDVDGFKAINDGHGHAVGDALLVALAGRMRHALRAGDMLARLSGDEFAVLMPGLSDAGVGLERAQSLRQALRSPLVVAGVRQGVTVSLGLALGRGGRDSPAALLALADAAMYRAKRAGRDRCELSDTGI